MPLRRLRRKLREIRYYSATRQSSGWSRAADIALAAGLVAAWPLVLSLDRGVVEGRTHLLVTGKLMTLPDGTIWSGTTSALATDRPPMGVVPHGSFELRIVSERSGWPFTSSASPQYPVLEVTTYVPRQTLTLADLEVGAPLREGVAAALASDGEDPALDSLLSAVPADLSRRVHLRGWAGNVVVLSLGLAVSFWMLVGLARLTWIPVRGRRLERHVERARDGLCSTCGYDLRGNPFGGHCPECGAVV